MEPGKKILMLDYTKTRQQRYRQIAFELNEHIERLNPEHDLWEGYIKNFTWQKKTGVLRRFQARDGLEMLKTLLMPEDGDNDFSIYEFKRNGLAINNKSPYNNDGDEWYYVLPACHEGFHRDWEKDCICVKDLPPSE